MNFACINVQTVDIVIHTEKIGDVISVASPWYTSAANREIIFCIFYLVCVRILQQPVYDGNTVPYLPECKAALI
jgi:hypothetical protein